MTCLLSPAHLTALAAFQFYALLLYWAPALAPLPLAIFVLVSLLLVVSVATWTTLFIVASKTFTTTETMLNAASALSWMAEAGVEDADRPVQRRHRPAPRGSNCSGSRLMLSERQAARISSRSSMR